MINYLHIKKLSIGICIMFFSLGSALPSPVSAHNSAYDEPVLRSAFYSFNNDPVNCYKSVVMSRFLDTPQKWIDTVNSLNYLSKKPFCFYSESVKNISYLSSNEYVNVDHKKQVIFHYNIKDDEDLVPENIKKQSYITQIDSLLKTSTIKKVTKKGGYTVYHIEPEGDNKIQDLEVTCDVHKGKLISLNFDIEYVIPNTDNIKMRYRISIENTAGTTPPVVEQLLFNASSIRDFYKKNYPKYTFQEI